MIICSHCGEQITNQHPTEELNKVIFHEWCFVRFAKEVKFNLIRQKMYLLNEEGRCRDIISL